MKKIFKVELILIICLLSFTGCVSELDVENEDPDALLVNQFYSTPESYLQGLAGVYANLTLTGLEGINSSNIEGAKFSQYTQALWFMTEMTTDEVVYSWETDPGTSELNRNTWTANNVVLLGMFSRAMLQVAFANEYLRQPSDEVLTTRNVDNELRSKISVYRAEARFLRVLSYYHLMDLYGKAPFVTEFDEVGAFKAPQYDRPQLFNFIESELLEIISQLKEPLQNDYARVDQAAAWMILAKIYLNAEVYISENKYTECIEYCEKILNSGYSLAPTYLNNFNADNHENNARNEIIFPIVSDAVFSQTWGSTTTIVNGQVGAQEANGGDFGLNAGGWGGAFRVTRQFSEIFLHGDFAQDDRNTLITENRPIDIIDIADRNTGYIIGKWSNKKSTGENGAGLELVETDYPLFRLADVYLMYAEAHLRGGGGSLTQAIHYFNDLRNRANNPNTVSGGDLTLDLILNERLVELHWEAHRRQDLIRFNKFTGGNYNWAWKGDVPNGIPISSHMDVFPIPAASISANPNLIQNQGY